ncbi:hypothetical protein CR513_39784, partial [Mucuna pruriens]
MHNRIATVNQAIWLIKILSDLHVEQTTITISNNPIFHGKTRHFKMKLFFLREEQKEDDSIAGRFKLQSANVLTKKALQKTTKFHHHSSNEHQIWLRVGTTAILNSDIVHLPQGFFCDKIGRDEIHMNKEESLNLSHLNPHNRWDIEEFGTLLFAMPKVQFCSYCASLNLMENYVALRGWANNEDEEHHQISMLDRTSDLNSILEKSALGCLEASGTGGESEAMECKLSFAYKASATASQSSRHPSPTSSSLRSPEKQ